MITHNVTPTIVTYNGVYSALASSGSTDLLVATFQDMKRNYNRIVQPNYITYFHVTRCICKVNQEEERLAYLWRVYALMDSHDRQVAIGGRLLEAMIQTYGALGHFDEAKQVYESISGISNAECLRAVLFACSVAEPPEWEIALSLLHTSDILDGAGPGLIEPGALCNAMLACSKAGEWEESLQLLRLYGERSEISILAVNSLIAACGRAGRPDMSMEILYEIEGWGMKLDSRSYRIAIIACNQAEHSYRRTLPQRQQNTQSNRTQNKHAVKGKIGFEWWECAISLLRRMQENGLQPDTPTLSSVISACEAAGEWQRALFILQSAMNHDASAALNVYCFNAAIAACEKGGAWVEALEIYEKMKEQGGSELRPNLVTISSLILALDNAGQKEFAVNIYREGIRKQFIQSPWRTTKDTISEEPILALDLHSYTAAMTRAALRNHMNTLLRQGKIDVGSDLIIIVGQGHHSMDGRPVLKDAVLSLFETEFGIVGLVDERNLGRVTIPASHLQQHVSRNRWQF
jgi:pentatricopeptide repeat protein